MKIPDQKASESAAASPAATRRTTPPPNGVERRRNSHLRELIDEMLASVRVATNRDLWTAEERQGAEQELARIMERIRAQTFRDVT